MDDNILIMWTHIILYKSIYSETLIKIFLKEIFVLGTGTAALKSFP